jgi:hypothetical protein
MFIIVGLLSAVVGCMVKLKLKLKCNKLRRHVKLHPVSHRVQPQYQNDANSDRREMRGGPVSIEDYGCLR